MLSFKTMAQIEALRSEVAQGLNPKVVKDALALEITERFHGAAAAAQAQEDFALRSKGGVPENLPEVVLSGAPLGVGAMIKAAGLAASVGEANRLIAGQGVKINGELVSDHAVKLEAGVLVLQVGKRRFARVTLS